MPAGDRSDEQLKGKASPPNVAVSPVSAVHEIKNPLDSLLNLLYLLESEATLTEKGRRYLTLAQEEVRRTSQIADATLGQAKLSTKPEKTDISQLLATVLDFYKQRFEAARVTVHTEYACHESIPAYAAQLRQVFSNLLLNAAEAMPQGGTIHARVHAGQEWRGNLRRGVRITIADDGCGISSTLLPQVFQEGFTMKPGGHGMGLSFVMGVVQKHKGRLRVKSSVQPRHHGTVFNLFLPAA